MTRLRLLVSARWPDARSREYARQAARRRLRRGGRLGLHSDYASLPEYVRWHRRKEM